MNIDNMKTTRDLIAAAEDEHFDMQSFVSCGTIFCIAGFALIAAGYKEDCNAFLDGTGETVKVSKTAQDWLGLTYTQACHLFYGGFSGKLWADITREEALAELDRMIEEACAL